MAKSCDFAMLCGISSRFQLLSPCTRQVTHALLTRPPLGTYFIWRIAFHKFLVRLACVKHAASVHPEPGSNSHKKFNSVRTTLASFFKKFFRSPFYLFKGCCSFLNFLGFFKAETSLESIRIFRDCITVQLSRFCAVRFMGDSLLRISLYQELVNNFFNFLTFFLIYDFSFALVSEDKCYIITKIRPCQ